jgi:phage shock protein A
MSKRGIIGRVAQLAQVNVGAVIDSAEVPQQTADQLARDYGTTIAETEHAIAQLASSRRMALHDQREDAAAAELWAGAAAASSQTADELRAAGDAAAADRFDGFARVALVRQLVAEHEVETREHTIAAQAESVETLTNGLSQMQIKMSELTHRRRSLAAGPGWPRAHSARPDRVVRNVDVLDPASEVALFQEMVRQEEAGTRGTGVARASQADAQLAEFASSHRDKIVDAAVDERLQALKTGRAMTSALARAQDSGDQLQRHDPRRAHGQPFR